MLNATPLMKMEKKSANEKAALMQWLALLTPDLLSESVAGQVDVVADAIDDVVVVVWMLI